MKKQECNCKCPHILGVVHRAGKPCFLYEEPVKLPSDAQLKEFWRQLTEAGGDEVDFARALLARYGQPAQHAESAKPVGYGVFWREKGQDCSMLKSLEDDALKAAVSLGIPGASVEPVFRGAAPVAAQPSVPEPLKYGGNWKDHYVTGWNDCRAAMLAAGQAQQDAPTPEEEEAWQRMERRS